MKIKIRKDALQLYIKENTDYLTLEYYGEDYWEQVMEKISGKVLNVDTRGF